MPVTFRDDPIQWELDARKLAEVAAQVIAEANTRAIQSGLKGDGSGPQEPAKMGDRNGIRGYDKGVFARSLRVQIRRGSKGQAVVTVGPVGLDPARTAWLEREAKRGITYVYPGEPGTPLSKKVDDALQAMVDQMIR